MLARPSTESPPPARIANPKTTSLLEPRDHTALIWNDEEVSYHELLRRARSWSHLMPEAGARVIVFSENSPTWVCCAYAIWSAQAVLVPVDYLSTAEELAYVVDDCEPVLLFCSSHVLPTVRRALTTARCQPRLLVLDDLATTTAAPDIEEACNALRVDESALATIVYTSGTTGDPKGVMLSFGNLLTNVRAVVNEGYFTPTARVLLLLPLHHVLPLAGSLIAPLFGGSTIVFATSLAGDDLVANLRQHAITAIVGVPRFYDVLQRALRERIEANPIARWLYALARRIRWRRLSRLIFGSVHRKFGGALQHLICGGAALNPDTAETFDVLGFQMCEGFGMTECAPMIAFPRLHLIKLGSCGQVLDGCEARVTENGEIIARGPNVMLGYYNRPVETQALIRDGWLHTGDLGRFDAQGYLYVTGRLKEILVLGNGKKVNPATIESALLAASDAIRDAGVFLNGEALHALLLPNWDHLPIADRATAEAWLRRKVLEPYNAGVAPYRRVTRLTLVNDDLPRTRLGKLRRHLLATIAEDATLVSTEPEADALAANGSFARLATFLARQCGQVVKSTTRLSADLGLDSLGRVELAVFIQRAFGLTLPETRFFELETVGDLARFVEQYKRDEGSEIPDITWGEILQPKTPPNLPHSSSYHRAIVYVTRFAVRLLFRVAVRGRERLPAEPFILVSNHQSYFDGLFVCAFMSPHSVLRTLFYAKEQHVRRPWIRALAQCSNTIVMDPKQGFLGSLQQLATGLQRGNNLIIFPEGTRSVDGTLGPFKDSYAILACELDVSVVPVVIDGAHRVMPKGRRFPRFFGRISVTYLDAVRPVAGELAVSVNSRVSAVIAETLLSGRSGSAT